MTTLTTVRAPGLVRPRPVRRLLELDVLRGVAIVGMLLVNNPGDRATTPWPLRHSEWHGLTPADLVFPLFLLAIGLSLPFSRRSASGRAVVRRALLLWLVGAALSTLKDLSPDFGSGVLQHIAGAYVVAWLLLRLPRRWPLVAAGGLLAGIWAAMTFVSVPGVVPGAWAPSVNLAARIDEAVFGAATSEGVVAMLASSATIVGGAWLGGLLLRGASDGALLLRGFAVGAVGAVVALGVPVNKKLWSPSYALVTFALAVVLLVAVRLCLRAFGAGFFARRLAELGGNPIAVYVVFHALSYTVLLLVRGPAVSALAGPLGPVAAGVAYSVAVVVAAAAFAHVLARRGIRWRL